MLDSLQQVSSDVVARISDLSLKVDRLSNRAVFTFWAPIIAAAITAFVGTLLGQAIQRRNEKSRDLREAHSKCVNLKIRLRGYFKRLAMFKFHAQYWWHMHVAESNDELRSKYYLEHLRSQSEARDTEKEIDEAIGEFLAEVVKFERLKGKGFNVDKEKIAIEKLKFPKAQTYGAELNADVLRNKLAENHESQLRERYFENLGVFGDIIAKML